MRTRRRNRSRRRSRRGGGPGFFERLFGRSSAPASRNPSDPLTELKMRKDISNHFEPLILPLDMFTRKYKAVSRGCTVQGSELSFGEVLTKLKEGADNSSISDIRPPLTCVENVVPIDLLVKNNGNYFVPGFDIKDGKIIFDFKKEYTSLQSLLSIPQDSAHALPPAPPTAAPLPAPHALLSDRLHDQGFRRSESVRRPVQVPVQRLVRPAPPPRRDSRFGTQV